MYWRVLRSDINILTLAYLQNGGWKSKVLQKQTNTFVFLQRKCELNSIRVKSHSSKMINYFCGVVIFQRGSFPFQAKEVRVFHLNGYLKNIPVDIVSFVSSKGKSLIAPGNYRLIKICALWAG